MRENLRIMKNNCYRKISQELYQGRELSDWDLLAKSEQRTRERGLASGIKHQNSRSKGTASII